MKTFRLSKFKLALFFIFLATLTLAWIGLDSTRLHVKRLIIPNNAFAQVVPGKKLELSEIGHCKIYMKNQQKKYVLFFDYLHLE